MASYGPSFFLPFMAQARSALAMKTRKEKNVSPLPSYNPPYLQGRVARHTNRLYILRMIVQLAYYLVKLLNDELYG